MIMVPPRICSKFFYNVEDVRNVKTQEAESFFGETETIREQE